MAQVKFKASGKFTSHRFAVGDAGVAHDGDTFEVPGPEAKRLSGEFPDNYELVTGKAAKSQDADTNPPPALRKGADHLADGFELINQALEGKEAPEKLLGNIAKFGDGPCAKNQAEDLKALEELLKEVQALPDKKADVPEGGAPGNKAGVPGK